MANPITDDGGNSKGNSNKNTGTSSKAKKTKKKKKFIGRYGHLVQKEVGKGK